MRTNKLTKYIHWYLIVHGHIILHYIHVHVCTNFTQYRHHTIPYHKVTYFCVFNTNNVGNEMIDLYNFLDVQMTNQCTCPFIFSSYNRRLPFASQNHIMCPRGKNKVFIFRFSHILTFLEGFRYFTCVSIIIFTNLEVVIK